MAMHKKIAMTLTLVLASLVVGCGEPSPTPGSISGSIWFENVANEPQMIRGAAIFLLPVKVERSKIKGSLEKLAKRDHPKTPKALNHLATYNSNGFQNVSHIWGAFVKTTAAFDEGVSDEAKYDALSSEPDWMPIVHSINLASTDSGPDGKYLIDKVPPGEYFIYTEYQTPLFINIWMAKITVPSGGSVSQNFHTGNAEIVQSKSVKPLFDFK
jgi:hypothetical protein